MGNASSKAFDTAGAIGLSTAAVAQLEATLASQHTAAAGLGHAATQHTTATRRRGGEKAKIGDLARCSRRRAAPSTAPRSRRRRR